MDKQHPGGINEAFVFTRRLLVDPGENDPDSLLEGLRRLDGLVSAETKDGGRLILRYDASRLHLDTLVLSIQALGTCLLPGPWQRLRLGWYRFVDHNAAQTAVRTDVHCCTKPPKMLKRRP